MAINIQNMCGNGGQTGGQTGGGAVNKVNGVAPGADGNVRLTADNLGAALAAINIQSVTKKYRRFIAQDGNEGVTPKNYLWSLGKGSFFLRAADGVYFVSCVDVADGLKARIYAMIPPTSANDGDVIDGGVYINNTKLAAFGSTEDLQELIFKIGGSPVVTDQALLTRLSDYVSNAALLLTLQGYAPISEPDFLGNIEVRPGTRSTTTTRIEPNKVKMFSGAASVTLSSSSHNENNIMHLYGTNETGDVIVRGVNTPALNNDAAPKSYVDAVFRAAVDGRLARAVYGETSYADIEEAFNAGKLIYMFYQDSLLLCYACGQGIAYFSSASTNYFVEVGVQGNERQTNWAVIGDGYVERKENKVNSLTASVTHYQYPSAKATYEAIKALSDKIIWKDVTDEWLEFRDNNSAVAFVTAARSFVKEQADGRYCFTSDDGDVVHARIVTAGTGNAEVKYRIIWFAPHGATDRLSFEYWQNDNRLIGTSTGDGILRLEMLGKQVVFKDEFSAALAGLPSRESVENAIRMEVRDVTSTYDQLSVVRTRLQKFANMKHTIRVEIENARMLLDEENVILQLWVCSRAHGTAHHWWHPSQPGSPTRTSKIGYAMIAGDLIYQNRPLETARFPAVPAWMPNNGYMQTEIPVTRQDLINGYVDIDCSKYFLPMIKPKSTQWRYKDVSLMFTQRAKNEYDRHSVPVTWTVGVLRDGQYKTIGSYFNAAKIGIPRGCDQTIVDGTSSRSKMIKHLYISVG